MSNNPPDQEFRADFRAELHRSLSEIAPSDWDSLNTDGHPFLRHTFLYALETSGSVGGDTGWDPLYLTVLDSTGRLLAAAPHYLKHHSYGEYIFDHGWADAFERAGGQYYPKSLAAVPFTPVPGPRLLTHLDFSSAKHILIKAMESLCHQHQLSSAHVNFITAEDEAQLREAGWLIRTSTQFHWQNNNYADFDAFLAALSSRKRKNIKKERRSLQDAGVTFQQITGSDLQPHHLDAFYQFYLATIDKKWGGAYLTRQFFETIAQHMANEILLVIAEKSGEMIAGALNFIGHDALYGRNWGCSIDIPNLHFETCYYQAIEFAIAHKLSRVEAGAQGLHKVQRGYMPMVTKSAHYIRHDGFRDAIARFLTQEAQHTALEADAIRTASPYRRSE